MRVGLGYMVIERFYKIKLFKHNMRIEDLGALIGNWMYLATPVMDRPLEYLLNLKDFKDHDFRHASKEQNEKALRIFNEYKQGYNFEGLKKMENYSDFF